MKYNERRKTLVVLKEFQSWFVLQFLSFVGLFLGIFGVSLLLWFRMVVKEVLAVSGLLSPTLVLHIEHSMFRGAILACALLAVMLGVATYHAYRFSRRIAGPLFAVSRHLSKCEKDKKLTPLKLREGDLFREIEVQFNQLAKTLENDSKKNTAA